MKVARIIGYILIALVMLIVFAVIFIDENRLKGYIEQQLTDIIGREVTIAGDFDIDLGWTSRVRLEGLHLSNAAWSEQSEMVQMAALEVGIELKSLLLGRIIIPEVMVERPRILLCRPKTGSSRLKHLRWIPATPSLRFREPLTWVKKPSI